MSCNLLAKLHHYFFTHSSARVTQWSKIEKYEYFKNPFAHPKLSDISAVKLQSVWRSVFSFQIFVMPNRSLLSHAQRVWKLVFILAIFVSFQIFFPNLPKISVAKVKSVQRLFFLSFWIAPTHKTSQTKRARKFVAWGSHIYKFLGKKSNFDHCVCPKLPKISAAKVQRVRRSFLTFWIASTPQKTSHTKRARKLVAGGGHICKFFRKILFWSLCLP